jgi:hypothetical protein
VVLFPLEVTPVEMKLSICAVVTLSALASHVGAWDYSVQVNLAWPPVGHEEYVTLNGTWTGSHGQNDPFAPCANVPIAPDQKRTPFPTTGGRLQFDTVNNTKTLQDFNYIIDPYFGQISADTTQGYWRGAYIDTYVYEDFNTSSYCSPDPVDFAINATDLISGAMAATPGVRAMLTADPVLNIVGMNATVGVRMVLFHGDVNVEEMWQCAYVTFVSPESFAASGDGGLCNNGRLRGSETTLAGGLFPTSSPTVVFPPLIPTVSKAKELYARHWRFKGSIEIMVYVFAHDRL